MSLSFKVTLIKEDEQETRRFVLNEDTASRFSDLQQKIISIFPALDEREPVVSWLDDEGDEVRMANNEELKLALATMPGPVLRVRRRRAVMRKKAMRKWGMRNRRMRKEMMRIWWNRMGQMAKRTQQDWMSQ